MLKKNSITKTPNAQKQVRQVIVLDASNQILGRLATKIVRLLQGKHKTNFVQNINTGDYVVVTNASFLKTTGNKIAQKVYTHYTGYPGGLRTETLGAKMQRKPTEVLELAVSGMLPNNKLRQSYLRNLFVFKGADYQLPKPVLEILRNQENGQK